MHADINKSVLASIGRVPCFLSAFICGLIFPHPLELFSGGWLICFTIFAYGAGRSEGRCGTRNDQDSPDCLGERPRRLWILSLPIR